MALVGVKYVGKKKSHLDHLYGTGLIWQPGQIHNIPEQIAQKMAPHTDVYKCTNPVVNHIVSAGLPEVPAAALQNGAVVDPAKDDDPQITGDETISNSITTTNIAMDDSSAVQTQLVPLPHLDTMSRDELMNFALQHYGEKLHHSMKEDTMRHKIISLINERGR